MERYSYGKQYRISLSNSDYEVPRAVDVIR